MFFKKTKVPNSIDRIVHTEEQDQEKEVSVLEPSNKEVIEEIHNCFEIAGDKLLAEAQNIIDQTKVDKELYDDMISLGFISSKKVKEAEKTINQLTFSKE